MHFYEGIKQKFVYIYLFVLARRFYRFLKIFANVGYDILERGYRYMKQKFRHLIKVFKNISVTPASLRFDVYQEKCCLVRVAINNIERTSH